MQVVFASAKPWPMPDPISDRWAAMVVGLTVDAQDLPAQLLAAQPHVAFLSYPTQDLIQIIAEVRAHSESIALVPYLAEPSPQALLELMRIGVSDILTEYSANACNAILARVRATLPTRALQPRAKRMAFVSAKGGSGASFVIANLASALAAKCGGRVLIVDLSLPFGDVDIYLSETSPRHDLLAFCEEIERLDFALLDAMVHHIGPNLDVIPSPCSIDRVVKIVSSDVVKLIKKIDKEYSFILFDLGSSIDQIGLQIIDTLDSLTIIAKLELPSVRRAGQLVKLLEDIEFPATKLQLVTNEFSDKPAVSAREFEQAVGHAAARHLPDAGQAVATSLARSAPVVDLAPRATFSRAIHNWAATILGITPKGRKLWEILSLN